MSAGPMTLSRLEWLRLTRTHRWAVLVVAYVFFAVLGVLGARYLAEILHRFGGGIVVEIPPPRPVDAVTQFLSNAGQLGLLAVVIVAAGALAVDARPEVGAFLRTRVERARRLLWPRYVAVTLAAILALVLGTLVTAALTAVLIGPLPAGVLTLGTLLGALYLAFAVAVVAAIASHTRGTVSLVFATVAVLLLLPVVGLWPPIRPWLPSELLMAAAPLVEGAPASDYLRSVASAVVLTVVLLVLAGRGLERREP